MRQKLARSRHFDSSGFKPITSSVFPTGTVSSSFCWGARKVGQLCRQTGVNFTLFSLWIPLCNHSVSICSSSVYKDIWVPSICSKNGAGSSMSNWMYTISSTPLQFLCFDRENLVVVISKTSNISWLTRERLLFIHSLVQQGAAGDCTSCTCGIESQTPPHNSPLQEAENSRAVVHRHFV